MTEQERYDQVWSILKLASADWKAAGIPDHELPPAIADFLSMMILAMSNSEEIAEEAIDAITERMKNTLCDWKTKKPPFA